MKVKTLLVVAACLMVPAIGTAQMRQAAHPKLQGAWRIIENSATGPNGFTDKNPRPGLWVFTAKHYSFAREDSARKDPANPTAPTVAELSNLLRFSAQSGTYEFDANGEVVLHRVAALGVTNMAPGNFSRYVARIEGDSLLFLTQQANQAGAVSSGITTKLRRVE